MKTDYLNLYYKNKIRNALQTLDEKTINFKYLKESLRKFEKDEDFDKKEF